MAILKESTVQGALDVEGDITASGALTIGGNMEMTGGDRIITATAGYAMLRSNTSHIYLRAQGSAGAVYISSGGTATRLFIKSDGDVGINTTAPTAKLHVNGDLKVVSYMVTSPTLYKHMSGTWTSFTLDWPSVVTLRLWSGFNARLYGRRQPGEWVQIAHATSSGTNNVYVTLAPGHYAVANDASSHSARVYLVSAYGAGSSPSW